MMSSVFTLDKLMEMKRIADDFGPAPEIYITPIATTDGERYFPTSRHRSRRIEKKLVKRFGGVYRQVPTCYRVGNQMLVHPALWTELRYRAIEKRNDTNEMNYLNQLTGLGCYIW